MAKTVLITGISGFVGAHVARAFLSKGYKVKGAVRSDEVAKGVLKTQDEYKDQLSFVVVPDLMDSKGYEGAFEGVAGVIHVGSPMLLNTSDFEKELFEPSIDGTLAILTAIENSHANVERVVITASFADVLDPLQGLRPGYAYTEADWNPVTRQAAAESENPVLAYLTAKTVAEQEAWAFVEKHKSKFTLATLLPPFIYGPIIHQVRDMKKLNTSSNDIYRLFNGSEKEVPPTAFWSFVDVRDIADAHVLAFEKPSAAGQRYLVASHAYSYQQCCDIIREKFPELKATTPEGKPNDPLPPVYSVDTSKIVNEFGMKFRPLEETIVDAVNSMVKLEKQLK